MTANLSVIGRRMARNGVLPLLASFLILVSACGGGSLTTAGLQPTVTVGGAAPNDAALATLQNMRDEGFDASAHINGASGGLSNNWLYGTNPVETYIDASTDAPYPQGDPGRTHDPLVDIRYLHALWLYKNLYPSDTQFNGEIARYTPIVETEFANPHDTRGFLFDMLTDLAGLSNNAWYTNAAKQLAASYSAAITASPAPVAFKTSVVASGHYRVDYALQIGCALIEAGVRFANPTWVTQGRASVAFVYAHAYIASAHVFTSEMAGVMLPNGQINPNETFFSTSDSDQEYNGNEVRMASVGLDALSLLHVYLLTRDATFLQHATDLLDTFTDQGNSLGMWDAQNLGYFDKASFTGTGPSDPGQVEVVVNKKESGRQLVMLEAFHVANSVTNNRYAQMQAQMLNVALNKAYYAPSHGYLYEMQANWQPLPLRAGNIVGTQNWVTAEAMGIALEAIFSTRESIAW